jgi:hypothetical protein
MENNLTVSEKIIWTESRVIKAAVYQAICPSPEANEQLNLLK